MPDVFPVIVNFPVTHEIRYYNYVANFGNAFEQRVNKNLAFTRADGNGNILSYRGLNVFTLKLDRVRYLNATPAEKVNALWSFYQTCLGSVTAFYFYNPVENPTIDLTGATLLGRYLVRFGEQMLSRDAFTLKLHNIGITLIEVRS